MNEQNYFMQFSGEDMTENCADDNDPELSRPAYVETLNANCDSILYRDCLMEMQTRDYDQTPRHE